MRKTISRVATPTHTHTLSLTLSQMLDRSKTRGDKCCNIGVVNVVCVLGVVYVVGVVCVVGVVETH